MRSKKTLLGLIVLLVITAAILLVTGMPAVAQTETVLHNFNGNHGASPRSNLVFDAAGNLYGTTITGGTFNFGTVFELTPDIGGGWTEMALHSFNENGKDGTYPNGGLIFDGSGNLYGTTISGGAANVGTMFELAPQTGGGWTEKILHGFNGTDGIEPFASLIFDGAGNLYATTVGGGAFNHGTVFELKPKAGGGWTERILRQLAANSDGDQPHGAVILDAAGNLYGTALAGGSDHVGTVFELTPSSGQWTETLLHTFMSRHRTDGDEPYATLIFDAEGNLYGTSSHGGASNYGTVFELTPATGGGWTMNILYSFKNNGIDGFNCYAGLVLDGAGNLYGTTSAGGAFNGGTVFELTPVAGGGWSETILHSFGSSGEDGLYPQGALILDAAGNLYGTTSFGGTHHDGTVFEIKP
jgi:uncharacterized repeat protein (TIGR03803 family)